jgi:hypothetical protein
MKSWILLGQNNNWKATTLGKHATLGGKDTLTCLYLSRLDQVKKRIIEYLSVAKIKGDLKAPIICFVGPVSDSR